MVDTFLAYAQAIGDLCVIGITVYTFYLSFYSKRIDRISCGVTTDLFDGDSLSFVFQSKTMMTIEIKNIFVITKSGGCVKFDLSDATVLEGRRSVKISTGNFTKISGIDDLISFISKIKVVFLDTGNEFVCAKTGFLKCIPNFLLTKRYSKELKSVSCAVIKTTIEGRVVSDKVGYAIYILSEKEIVNVLMTKNGITNIAVGGHNGYKLPSDNVDEMREYLANTWDIDSDKISVIKVG